MQSSASSEESAMPADATSNWASDTFDGAAEISWDWPVQPDVNCDEGPSTEDEESVALAIKLAVEETNAADYRASASLAMKRAREEVVESNRVFEMQKLAKALPATEQATLEVVRTFALFKQLPAELRAEVIDFYLFLEREEGRLSKHCHYDDWGSRCCVWEYPDLLIACDNEYPEIFPDPKTGRCPRGWIPALALTDKAMLGEVTVHMLTRTARFDFKYIRHNHNFKTATWFREFLASIPGGNSTVQYLNFPHMHWFNNFVGAPAPTNPSVELMAACKNLRKVDMTFHSSVMQNGWDLVSEIDLGGLTAQQLADKFHLEPIFECEKLEEVYFDGIYKFGGDITHLDPLVDLAKWIIKGFRDRGQIVQVEVGRRCGRWLGRVPGTLIELGR